MGRVGDFYSGWFGCRLRWQAGRRPMNKKNRVRNIRWCRRCQAFAREKDIGAERCAASAELRDPSVTTRHDAVCALRIALASCGSRRGRREKESQRVAGEHAVFGRTPEHRVK